MAMTGNAGLVARLAAKDVLHDRRLFACFVLTLAAILAPLLILFGLKTGVVDHLLGGLRRDPVNREIIHRGHRSFTADWFAAMTARPEIAFVAPRTRQLSLTVNAGKPADPLRGRPVELVVSGNGDPALGAAADGIAGDAVVISERLAIAGGYAAGDPLLIWAIRRGSAGPERVDVSLRIAAVAPPRASTREAIFGPLGLVADVEDFLEGRAVAARGWGGSAPPTERLYPSFRLYAATIEDVQPLERELIAAGLQVETNAAAIAWTLSLDRHLTELFGVLTACAAVGFAIALAASLWANVERKRRALSLLRLMGVRRSALPVFPMIQAAVVALAGAALATLVALAVAAAINAAYGGAYLEGGALCRILPLHLAAAAAAALLLSLLAGAAAVRPVLGIEPAEGIREV